MIKFNEEAAIKTAIELTKAVIENPVNAQLPPESITYYLETIYTFLRNGGE